MNVFDSNLEAIEALCFGDCDFGDEVAAQVFVDNSVGGSEECEDVRDEVTFVGMEVVPVSGVSREINLFRRPERCFGLFVHFPNVFMFDGEEDKTVWILLQEWLERKECVGFSNRRGRL